jgi:hypothetical protein
MGNSNPGLRARDERAHGLRGPIVGAEPIMHAASIQLDATANLVRMSGSARSLLGYVEHGPPSWFYSLIHGRDLLRVIEGMSDIVCGDRKSCTWVASVKKGSGGWKKLRLNAYNRLDEASADVIVFLRSVTE